MKKKDDWFLPAIEFDGSVSDCLTVVYRQEEARLYFVKALKVALCSQQGDCSDAINFLRQQVLRLKKSCDLRLGVLARAQNSAWFRTVTTAEWGPFPGEIHKEAIFTEFSPEKAKKLRNELVEAWQDRSTHVPSLPEGDCLWRRLLTLNSHWIEICQLREPYRDLRLDELPEALPDDLSCRSLEAFLSKVRGVVDMSRQELDRCFHQLFTASEEFLLSYYRPRQQGSGERQERRQSASARSAQDKVLERSLDFMDFAHTPDTQVLRRRYLELAKGCHPDMSGGDESRFKDLNFHYNRILKAIQRL